MRISYNIVRNNISWIARINQLNSDTLLRHVRMKGSVGSEKIGFSYCEKTCEGKIINGSNEIIGKFLVF